MTERDDEPATQREVVWLPKDDSRKAWEMLVAAIRASDERTGYARTQEEAGTDAQPDP